MNEQCNSNTVCESKQHYIPVCPLGSTTNEHIDCLGVNGDDHCNEEEEVRRERDHQNIQSE